MIENLKDEKNSLDFTKPAKLLACRMNLAALSPYVQSNKPSISMTYLTGTRQSSNTTPCIEEQLFLSS